MFFFQSNTSILIHLIFKVSMSKIADKNEMLSNYCNLFVGPLFPDKAYST